MVAGVIRKFEEDSKAPLGVREMLFFQIVALFRDVDIWVATAGAAIIIPLTIFEVRRHSVFRNGKDKDTFLRDHLDW